MNGWSRTAKILTVLTLAGGIAAALIRVGFAVQRHITTTERIDERVQRLEARR